MNNTGSAILICFGAYLVWNNVYSGWFIILAGVLTWLIYTHMDERIKLLQLTIKKMELEIKILEKKIR